MKYVKFIANNDPETWFKAGTEVLYEDEKWVKRRMTYDEYIKISTSRTPMATFVGIRVCEDNPNENGNGYTPGEERIDGEWCSFDEFDIELVEEDKTEL